MNDEQHPHRVTKGSRSASPNEEISSQHNTHGQHKEQLEERESPMSRNKEHQHDHRSHQSNTTTTPAAGLSSRASRSRNYNVNVQFDPAIPQAGKPTHLSLVVTEQRVGEPIKDFEIIHEKLCI